MQALTSAMLNRQPPSPSIVPQYAEVLVHQSFPSDVIQAAYEAFGNSGPWMSAELLEMNTDERKRMSECARAKSRWGRHRADR